MLVPVELKLILFNVFGYAKLPGLRKDVTPLIPTPGALGMTNGSPKPG